MSEIQVNIATIREYLLGRISDEETLEEIEDSLFSDDEFCKQVELIEDELINNYALHKLDSNERLEFEKTLEYNPERKSKVKLAKTLSRKAKQQVYKEKTSLLNSIKSIFRQPGYAISFGVLLIVIMIGSVYFLFLGNSNELAELKKIYKTERPVNARISGFEYAPYVAERSENNTASNKNKLRLIENKLLERVENTPTAETYHSLGVFYLTQRNFPDAINNLKKALAIKAQNINYANDLGIAYFEQAKNIDKEKRLEILSRANEEFTRVYEIDETFITALFNRSLVLQELNLQQQAKQSWNDYLEKDATSKWAEEARKNLERLKQEAVSFKQKDEVLDEFWNAFHHKNNNRVWEIHTQTKGIFNGTSLYQQLTRDYLELWKRKDRKLANQNLVALRYIGNLEKEKHADFFLLELSNYYSSIDKKHFDELIIAKELLAKGVQSVKNGEYADSIKHFDQSKDAFLRAENYIESEIARLWVAEMLPDVGKIDESQKYLQSIIINSENKRYKTILPGAYYWQSVGKFRKKEFSKAIYDKKKALEIAVETENVYETKHIIESLAITNNFLGNYDIALKYLSKLNNDDEFYTSKSQVWRNLFTITEVLRKLNLNNTAVEFALESVKFSKTNLPNTPAVDASLKETIGSLSNKGKFDEALELAIEANNIAYRKLKHPGSNKVLADSLLELANVKRKMGDCTDALSDYDKSLKYYLKMPEISFSLYEVQKGRLLCFKKLNLQNEVQNVLQKLFELSEEYRQNIREDSVRQAFFDSEQIVFDIAISKALSDHHSKRAFELLEKSKARSLLDFVSSDKSIAEVEKGFFRISKPLSIKEIQTRLPTNTQILQYSMLDDKLAMWLLAKDKLDYFEQKIDSSDIEKKLLRFRQGILEKDESDKFKELAKQLYQLFIPKNIDQNKVLCLVLDKSLNQIPFSALISSKGTFLIEDFPITYSPSSSIFILASENANLLMNQDDESLLVIGNPKFNALNNPRLADLPKARFEAQTIAKNYTNSISLLGEDATKSKFLSSFEEAGIIHFAGHFIANGQSPNNSKLVFADEDLHSFELTRTTLSKSKLVVLSACETAFEKVNKSEGAIGISRTFLALGTPIVIASSWKVDSEATKDLMILFHQYRTELDLSSIESLRQAQIALIRNEKTKSPYYWSAFSSIGGFTTY